MTGPTVQDTPTRRPRRVGIMIAVGVLALAFAWLIWGGLDKNVVFFLTPNELLAKGAEGVNVPVRLGGQVKPGSIHWDDKALDLQFVLVDIDGKEIGRAHV